MQIYATELSVDDIHTLIETGVQMTLIDEHEDYGEFIRVKLQFNDGLLVEEYSEADDHYITRTIENYKLHKFQEFEILELPVIPDAEMTADQLFSCLSLPSGDKGIVIYADKSYPEHPKLQSQNANSLIQPIYSMSSTKFKVGGVSLRSGVVYVSIMVSKTHHLSENDLALFKTSHVIFCFLRFKDDWYGVGNGWIVPN